MNALSNLAASLIHNEISRSQTQLGALRIKGDDARKFLQGQVSCDMTKLSTESSLYGAICSIKGRIITNFFAVQEDDGLLLIMSKDLVDTSLNHLKKYAVFFKVELVNASDDYCIQSEFNDTLASDTPDALPELLPTTFTDNQTIFTISEFPVLATIVLQPIENSAALTTKNPEQNNVLSLLTARPLITEQHSEEILPQWLNMQRTGGISFTKGCYTGQEIVARMQYRGKSKKQLALFSWEGTKEVSTSLLDKEGKNIGNVLQQAHCNALNIAQVMINVDPNDVDAFFLGDQEITLLPLPYLLESAK
ncbi:MAG: CAF17-like 4Fe-4S cluster assembly/insertion protein YgfZ [Marinomonas sp.]